MFLSSVYGITFTLILNLFGYDFLFLDFPEDGEESSYETSVHKYQRTWHLTSL